MKYKYWYTYLWKVSNFALSLQLTTGSQCFQQSPVIQQLNYCNLKQQFDIVIAITVCAAYSLHFIVKYCLSWNCYFSRTVISWKCKIYFIQHNSSNGCGVLEQTNFIQNVENILKITQKRYQHVVFWLNLQKHIITRTTFK